MTRVELKTLAKSQINGTFLVLFLCLLSISLINEVLSFIPIAGSIVSIIIIPAFSLSMSIIYLNLVNGNIPVVGDIFTGFKNFWRAFLLGLLACIFIVLWSLLLILPGIVKSCSYSMAFYILAENPDISIMDALNESKRLMDGHKMELFVL